MLVGETPYAGNSAQAIIAKQLGWPVPSARVVRGTVSSLLDAAIRRALAKAPADRYPTVAQFARALTGSRDRRRVRSDSLGPKAGRRVPRAGLAIDPLVQQRRVMVLSCKLVGSNELDPQDVPAIMGRYQQACADCVKRYDGHISERRGAVGVALFGFPGAHAEEAGRGGDVGGRNIQKADKARAGGLKAGLGSHPG